MKKTNKTVRVTPTITKKAHDVLLCFKITPKEALENYSYALIYDDKINNEIKFLNEKKKFYQDIIKNASDELEKINEKLDDLEQSKKEIKDNTEKNILKAQEVVLYKLNDVWNSLNGEYFKHTKKVKFKEIKKIADQYKVPVTRIFPIEPYKNFYKKTFDDYEKYIDPILLKK